MREAKITLDIIEQDKVWITRDGRVLRLEEMEPTHRRNTLRLLERKKTQLNLIAFWRYFGSVDGPNGEVAQSCFEREMDRFIYQDLDEWFAQQPLICRLRTLVDDDSAREHRLALKLAHQRVATTAGPVKRPRGLRHE